MTILDQLDLTSRAANRLLRSFFGIWKRHLGPRLWQEMNASDERIYLPACGVGGAEAGDGRLCGGLLAMALVSSRAYQVCGRSPRKLNPPHPQHAATSAANIERCGKSCDHCSSRLHESALVIKLQGVTLATDLHKAAVNTLGIGYADIAGNWQAQFASEDGSATLIVRGSRPIMGRVLYRLFASFLSLAPGGEEAQHQNREASHLGSTDPCPRCSEDCAEPLQRRKRALEQRIYYSRLDQAFAVEKKRGLKRRQRPFAQHLLQASTRERMAAAGHKQLAVRTHDITRA